MSKRLVMCCDGTWSSADQRATTNVVKVARSVAQVDEHGLVQRTFYQPGVGTKSWERIRGGLFGFGLSRNVRETYRFIVENFEPGDELFFLGFSRGAYTARSTVGLLRNAGVLRREEAHRIDEAYALYRSRAKRKKPANSAATRFRSDYSYETRIRFIGVWDTVGALGIPFTGSWLTRLINRRWSFHDTTLTSWVDIACQALAIDERRRAFEPAVWERSEPANEHCEQPWFAGDHSNVGGGHRDTALSDIALLWMVEKARSAGLAFHADAFARTGNGDAAARNTGKCVAPDAHGWLHDSPSGWFRWLRRLDRRLGVTDEDHESATSSAVERHREEPSYAPNGLTTYLARPGRRVTTLDYDGGGTRLPDSGLPDVPEPTAG